MANQDSTPEERQESRQGKYEAEPEGGPRERERQFLEERATRLVPNGAPRPPARSAAEEPEAAGLPSPPPAADALPQDFRRRLVEAYRRRQQSGQTPSAPAAGPAEISQPPPPQPPQPPPANNWIPIGPSVVRQGQGGVKPPTSGRTPAIAVAPGGNRVYIGAANGGVWRSDAAGQTWRSLMDAFDLNPTTPASDSLSVGGLAIDLANPDRVYVGSGEGDGAAYFGVGPIVTSNGGANPPAWTTEQAAPGSPSLAGTAFYALAVDPANPERVVAGTRSGVYRREPNGTGGFHWAQKTMGATTWVPSVVVATSGGTTTFYAARWGGPVYSSTDGDTWTIVGTGFPTIGVGRVALAVRRDNPSVVYAVLADGRVYRLDIADGTCRYRRGARQPQSHLPWRLDHPL
jgi:hypothetical protein